MLNNIYKTCPDDIRQFSFLNSKKKHKKKYSWEQLVKHQTDYDNTANSNKFLYPTDKNINISCFHLFVN